MEKDLMHGISYRPASGIPPLPHIQIRAYVYPDPRFDNDPSAGSPTETLLRLLLPLNDKVQWNSRDVAGSEPPPSRGPSSFLTAGAPDAFWPRARSPGRHASRRPQQIFVGGGFWAPGLMGWLAKTGVPSMDARTSGGRKNPRSLFCASRKEKLFKYPQCVVLDDASTATPGQAGLPAEFKHINKRRERNLQGIPLETASEREQPSLKIGRLRCSNCSLEKRPQRRTG
nr:hypothetical protein [Tanacetum cinerariifolium]